MITQYERGAFFVAGKKQGHIFKEGNKWRGQVTLGYDENGKRQRANVSGKTSAEVQKKLNAVITEYNKGEITKISIETFTEWADIWLNDFKKNAIAPRTYESYKYLLEQHIKPALGKIKLKDLQPVQIQKLVNGAIDKGLSPRTSRYLVTVIHGCLEQAVKNGILAKNVSKAVVQPKAEKVREMRVLSKEEQALLIEIMNGQRLGIIFILCLASGLRIGECLGLSWKNINFEEEYISVKEALQLIKKEVDGTQKYVNEIGKTKTKSSIRNIPIPPSVVARLKEHKELQQLEKDKVGEDYIDNDFVFATRQGKLLTYRNVCRRFNQLIEKAEMAHVNLHALRHSFATRLLESNEHPKVVQELLGHTSIQMTMDIYSHVAPDIKKKATMSLDKWFTA